MLESTLFPVTEVPIQMEGIVNPEAYKFIVRSDTSKIISCMTNEYKLVTNESIIETATPILKDCGAKLTECKTFSNGARTMWTWTIPDVSVDIGNGDMVNPTITLKNSYDVLRPNGYFIGIDWFSTKHSDFGLGRESDDVYTRTDIARGQFENVGNVHFSDEKHLRSLFSSFDIISLEEKVINIYEPKNNHQFSSWNIVARKR